MKLLKKGDELTNALYTCNLTTLVWKKHELVGDAPLGLYGSVRLKFLFYNLVI